MTVLVIFWWRFAHGLGFIIAWPMDSTSSFHAIINLFSFRCGCSRDRCSLCQARLFGFAC